MSDQGFVIAPGTHTLVNVQLKKVTTFNISFVIDGPSLPLLGAMYNASPHLHITIQSLTICGP